MKASATSREDK